MRLFLVLVLFAQTARAGAPSDGRIVLLPIDDRPAVAQFALMIGAVAGQDVEMPPLDMLGRFTRPADTAAIDRWLRSRDYSRAGALVVSMDMLAYGGLVASRTHGATEAEALARLEFFRWFRKAHPKIPVYAFNVIMRVAPTADARSRPWRDDLARWSELSDRAPKTGEAQLKTELEALRARIPAPALEDYTAARRRDLRVNLAAIDLFHQKQIYVLVLLQDDARLYGLHRRDQQVISDRLRLLGLRDRVAVYNGADEGSLSLVSRAALEKHRRPIRVFPRFSSAKSKGVIAPYEDRPLEITVESQIRASGAAPAPSAKEADYKLFINAPETSDAEFRAFLDELAADLKAGRPVALADLLFPPPHRSGADERIVERLVREDLVNRFAGYAAWNTAGNTLGTAIPHANMRTLAARPGALPPEAAARATAAHLEFLLHRFAGDYLYHDVVRPKINDELRRREGVATDELAPETYEQVNRRAAGELRPRVEQFFARHFAGRTHAAGPAGRSIRIRGLEDLRVRLPWPRTFEVTIEFRMAYEWGAQ